MAKKKFPGRLYVTRREEGTSDEYLACDANFADLAEQGEAVTAGVYELVEVGKLTASPFYQKLRAVK
jgi:hypothetical protein